MHVLENLHKDYWQIRQFLLGHLWPDFGKPTIYAHGSKFFLFHKMNRVMKFFKHTRYYSFPIYRFRDITANMSNTFATYFYYANIKIFTPVINWDNSVTPPVVSHLVLTALMMSSRQPMLVLRYCRLNKLKHKSGENLVCPTGKKDTFISWCNPVRILHIK